MKCQNNSRENDLFQEDRTGQAGDSGSAGQAGDAGRAGEEGGAGRPGQAGAPVGVRPRASLGRGAAPGGRGGYCQVLTLVILLCLCFSFVRA